MKKHIRLLGFWENICKFGHDYYAGTGNVLVHAAFSGLATQGDIQKSLLLLFKRHPLLRATIEEKQYRPFFEIHNDFSRIPIHFQNYDPNTWLSQVSADLQKNFDASEYLWQVHIYSSPDHKHHFINFLLHHAIADGLSAAQLIHQFLTYLSGSFHHTDSLPLLDCIEANLQQTSDWDSFLEQKKRLLEFPKEIWPFEQYVKCEQRKTQNVYYEFSESQTYKLLHACRKNETTLQSMLNGAILKATRYFKNKDLHTLLHTPVNLRNYCSHKITEENIGCYISMVTTGHSVCYEDSLWTLARDYRDKLIETIPRLGFCPHPFYIGDFDFSDISVLFESTGSTKQNYFNGGFGVSNLGALNFPKLYYGFSLENLIFCTNRAMGDYIIFLNVLGLHDKLRVLFSFAEPIISRATVERWITLFINELSFVVEDFTAMTTEALVD